MLKIGWLSTGRDVAARRLLTTMLKAVDSGKIEAEVSLVLSNREPGEDKESDLFLDMVKSQDIPLACVSSQRLNSQGSQGKQEYERRVTEAMAASEADLFILAGYMLIVGEEMCHQFPMLNLHPAAPGGPKGTWQQVIWQLICCQASDTGVTCHLVTPTLDEGPAATFCTFPLMGEPFEELWPEVEKSPLEIIKRAFGENFPLFSVIRREGMKREIPLLLSTIKAFSQGRLRIAEGKVADEKGKPVAGYDLTPQIERIISQTPA
ncbi:MAG: formyltransferase family protein [Chloroflexota bacterium]